MEVVGDKLRLYPEDPLQMAHRLFQGAQGCDVLQVLVASFPASQFPDGLLVAWVDGEMVPPKPLDGQYSPLFQESHGRIDRLAGD